MPGIQKFATQVTADVTLVTTAETVVATLANVSTPRSGARVTLKGTAQLTLGTGTTAVTVRIRRGVDATGVLINEANAEQIKTAAGSTEPFTVMCTESPAEQAGASYVLTLQQTGASANGTSLFAELEAEVES